MLNRVKEKKLDEFVKWDIKIKKILMEIWKFLFVIIEILLIIFVLWFIKDLLILVTIFTR